MSTQPEPFLWICLVHPPGDEARIRAWTQAREQAEHFRLVQDLDMMPLYPESALPCSAGSATSPISQDDVQALKRLADSMGFGRTHDMLRRVISACPYLTSTEPQAALEIIDTKALLDCMNGYLTVHARRDGTFEIHGAEKAAEAIRLVVHHNASLALPRPESQP